jgi:hypothetical protein
MNTSMVILLQAVLYSNGKTIIAMEHTFWALIFLKVF